MTVKEITAYIVGQLTPKYGVGEARWMMRIIMEDVKGYSSVDLALYGDRELGDATFNIVRSIVSRLLDDEPLQYILGKARFYGMEFKVSPAVLIPRPETEQLIDIIVDRERDKSDLRVLDVGTGSGCIAIALARNLLFPRVTAVDISESAVDIAIQNAKALKAKVNFVKDDIFNMTMPAGSLDIIVSNPPYITEKERESMEANVTRYEPASALFVPDDDPLRFYNAILKLAATALVAGGRVYFEMNPDYAPELKRQMSQGRWINIDILPDERGRGRFLIGTLGK